MKGLRCGYGIYEYNNGNIYEGSWKGNKKDSFGTLTTKSGYKY